MAMFTKNQLSRYLAKQHPNFTPEQLQARTEVVWIEVYDRFIRGSLSKCYRPWEVVPTSPKGTKIGIEFECGFDSRDDLTNVTTFLWKKFSGVVVDYEGVGACPIEITFSPVDSSRLSERHPLIRTIRKFKDIGHPIDAPYVGTHCNISTDKIRAASHDQLRNIARTLGSWYARVDGLLMFGRPCGSYMNNPQIRGWAENSRWEDEYSTYKKGNTWLEFKWFQSTWDEAQMLNYFTAMKNIAGMCDYLLSYEGDLARVDHSALTAMYLSGIEGGKVITDAEVERYAGLDLDGEDY